MLNAPMRIMIVAGVCVLGLIGLVVREGYERDAPTSQAIEMRMQAIDPRSLLSGHYVIVSLQDIIVTNDGADPCANFQAIENRRSWLAITSTGSEGGAAPPPEAPRAYAPVGARSTREEAQALGLAVRGWATCSEIPQEASTPTRTAAVQTNLAGIERFHAPQAEAERIDALMRAQAEDTQVYAMINVSTDGSARLVGLKVNGEIISLNWL